MNSHQPYGQQPQYGYQPPPSYGPPPKRGPSAGALVAIVTAVALAVAGAVVTVVLVVGGDDDESASDDGPTSETSESSDTGDVSDTSETTATIEGTGYSYPLPAGWSDVTAEAAATWNDGVDSAVAMGDSLESPATVSVVIGSAEGATVPGELFSDMLAEVEAETGFAARPIPAPQHVGGNQTSVVEAEGVNASGTSVRQLYYLTIQDGQAYTIVFTTTATADAEASAALDQLVDGWSWEA